VILLERDEAFRALSGHVDDAAVGHGRLVFVSGEAGVGKTTFVTAAASAARPRATVAISHCDGSATPAPLGPLSELAVHLPASVWPEGATRIEVFMSLVDSLRTPPTAQPYLLVIEDAHWADDATLDLLRHLARRIHGCRAVVVVTYRPEDAGPGSGLRLVLGDTASATGLRRIDLSSLTVDGVSLLVADHVRDHPGAEQVDPAHLHEVTGGNPFFVTEVLSGGAPRVPETVRDAVLARVSRLDEAAQRALEIVALAGSWVETGLLEDLFAERLPVIDEPLARGLLIEDGPDVRFRHELARLVVADGVPAGRRVHVHRRILAALTTRGASAARLVHHADACGDSAAVVELGTEAGAQAARLGSHREAVEQYRRVLRHADRLGDEQVPARRRAELLQALGYELYVTAQTDAAVATFEAARDLWAAAGSIVRVGDAWRSLSRLSWFAGRSEDAEEQARAAIDLLEREPGPTPELGFAYSNRAQLRMLARDLAGTRDWGARSLAVADQLEAGPARTELQAHALNNLGSIETTAGEVEAGTAMLLESLEVAREADLHEHVARAYANLASTAVIQCRVTDARRYLADGIRYCADRDLDAWTLYLEGWEAVFHLDRGDPARARRLAEALLKRPTLATIPAIEPLVVVGRVMVRRGEPGVAEIIERVAALADSTRELQRIARVVTLKCEVAWLAGDLATCAEVAREAWPVAAQRDGVWDRGAIARWLGPEHATSVERIAEPYAAELAADWHAAAALWEGLDSPFEQALSLARSGEREAMSRAVGLFEQVGAPAAAGRVRALLRAHGWPAPRTPRVSTRRHPAGLTAREAEVLDLLVEGLTDAAIAERLFISRRTAEHHVAAILTKLGVSTRRDVVSLPAEGVRSGRRMAGNERG
jgi:DNA-binding CsgD family transcriptional regulator/tetratricopeptide (TPR) repeat protein